MNSIKEVGMGWFCGNLPRLLKTMHILFEIIYFKKSPTTTTRYQLSNRRQACFSLGRVQGDKDRSEYSGEQLPNQTTRRDHVRLLAPSLYANDYNAAERKSSCASATPEDTKYRKERGKNKKR